MNNSEMIMQDFEQMMGYSITASLIGSLLTMLFSLAAFILMAIALYSMAKRRNIYHRWTAWVPVANAWMLGCISDQYRSVALGQRRSRRKLLVWLQGSYVVLSLLASFLAIRLLLKMWDMGMMDPAYLESLNAMDEQAALDLMAQILMPTMGLLLLCLPIAALSIVYLVFFYLALNDIFKSCDPFHATVYQVLSIAAGIGANMFFGLPLTILPAIFLFAVRKKDFGMPLMVTMQPPQIDQSM